MKTKNIIPNVIGGRIQSGNEKQKGESIDEPSSNDAPQEDDREEE
jgi:hypothetical protein